MAKFTLLPPKTKRPQLLLLILILVLLVGAFFWMRQRQIVTSDHVEAVMNEVKIALQHRDAAKLQKQIVQLATLSKKIADPQLAIRVRENAYLLAMIEQVWANNEVNAIKLFAERYQNYRGQMIYVEAFDPVLPYVKHTMLNVFLKQLDLRGAYCFMLSYPPVTTGKHIKYFAAIDQFLCGDPDGAELKLKKLLNERPDDKMIKSTIAYLLRLRKRGIAPRTTQSPRTPDTTTPESPSSKQ